MRKSPAGSWDRSFTGRRLPSRMTRPSQRMTHSAMSRSEAACANVDARVRAINVRKITLLPSSDETDNTVSIPPATRRRTSLHNELACTEYVFHNKRDRQGTLIKRFVLLAVALYPVWAQEAPFGTGLYQVMEKAACRS